MVFAIHWHESAMDLHVSFSISSALTTPQVASWKPFSGFPEGGSRAPVCRHPHSEQGLVFWPCFWSTWAPQDVAGGGSHRIPWRVGGGVGQALGVLRVPVDAAERSPSVVLPEACACTPWEKQSLSCPLTCLSASFQIFFLSLLMEVPSQVSEAAGDVLLRCLLRCPAERG